MAVLCKKARLRRFQTSRLESSDNVCQSETVQKVIHFEIKAFMMIMAFFTNAKPETKIIVDQILANFHMGGARQS